MIKNIKYKWVALTILLAIATPSNAQIDTLFGAIKIKYPQFLSLVNKNNLEYAAEKFNVNIAEANVEASRVFPDPQITIGANDNGQHRMQMGYGFSSELSWTMELGGKRKARINLAKSTSELTKALLEDYFRNLRADATLNYLASLKQKEIYEVQSNSYTILKNIAVTDSIRFKLGSITQIDAQQSKLESSSMLNEVHQSEADWKTSLLQLGIIVGNQKADSLYLPSGDLTKFDRLFDLNELITSAQNNRADLLAALKNKNVSQDILKLAKANRVLDLGLSLGVESAAVVTNIVAPTPSSNAVSAGITIPLKFSNRNKGELKAAEFSLQQADVLYQQTELQIQVEVRKAWFNYLTAQKQVRQFNTGLLADAQRILDGKVYSYKRGETSLLEVLNAQRTYNETQLNYYQTLYNYAAALVELEKTAGIWDINF
ncbi:cobalt-zinc-cadmium efflux system outer membrane protein [Flavobacterium sp. 90]|uniref:TolC family protein n=1 Tax=unclassified Flavobacterium TaxID=196869 RepID=UPI000EB56D10|nr:MULTISPECIES: TolC family protein [unclassified Flavobacterium]RKR05538.1 cobalt-zinc-cadmium efflux system outer membrane protein [Flavobacterium sp. 81]TCK56853.1 cobalt-zinc-cadmium efflux system outer membrane protein [Flavobacterium sp. 90]